MFLHLRHALYQYYYDFCPTRLVRNRLVTADTPGSTFRVEQNKDTRELVLDNLSDFSQYALNVLGVMAKDDIVRELNFLRCEHQNLFTLIIHRDIVDYQKQAKNTQNFLLTTCQRIHQDLIPELSAWAADRLDDTTLRAVLDVGCLVPFVAVVCCYCAVGAELTV